MEPAFFMRAALQESLKAFDEGEVPIGAVIEKDGVIIGRGYNRMENLEDATAHAEIIAISAASDSISSWRLNGCTIYVTLEPCLMCLGAIVQSRIDRIVYGATDPRLGSVDSHFYRQQIEHSYGSFPQVHAGLLGDESSHLLTSFFRQARKKN